MTETREKQSGVPRIAECFLRLIAPAEMRDALLGDLEEEYHSRAEGPPGPRAARRWYRSQVASSSLPLLRERVALSRRRRSARPRGRNGVFLDLRSTLRPLLRKPGFALLYVVTVGIGVGLATAVLSVVDRVLLTPLHYPQPDRLVVLWETNLAGGGSEEPVSKRNFWDWREQNGSFAAMAAWTIDSSTLRDGDELDQVVVAAVTADFFRVMSVPPLLGRAFLPGEDLGEPSRIVLLGERTWEERFSRDETILGRVVTLDREPFEIVGVMPRSFRAPMPGVEIFRPLSVDPARDSRKHRYLNVVARLADGIELEEAQADLDVIASRLEAAHPDSNEGWRVRVVPALAQVTGATRPALLALAGSVLLLLLVASANGVSLAMARGVEKRDEMRLRATLGASPNRLRLHSGLQGVALAGGSLVVGLGIAFVAVPLVLGLEPGLLARSEEVGVSGRAMTFGAIAALVASLAGVCFQPRSRGAWTGGRVVGGAGKTGARRVLLVTEIALSLVLLLSALLLTRSFLLVQKVDPGFRWDSVLVARVELDRVRYSDKPSVIRYFELLRQKLSSMTGVEAVGFTTTLPMTRFGVDFDLPFAPEGVPRAPGREREADYRVVTPGYFEALRIPLVEGRTFDDGDRTDGRKVMVVSRSLARELSPNGLAVGRRIQLFYAEPPLEGEVVGVVEDVRHRGLGADARPELYVPLSQVRFAFPFMTMALRTSGAEPLDLAARVREAALAIDPDEPLYGLVAMESLVHESLAQDRFLATLLAIFSGAALTLAAAGLYALVSYHVARRRAEIGIRMAMGADRSRVLREITGEAMAVTALGITAGALLGGLAVKLLGGLVHHLPSHDAWIWLGAVGSLLAIAALAAYLPARRAATIDPASTLRHD